LFANRELYEDQLIEQGAAGTRTAQIADLLSSRPLSIKRRVVAKGSISQIDAEEIMFCEECGATVEPGRHFAAGAANKS